MAGDPFCSLHGFSPCRCREFRLQPAEPFTTTGTPTCSYCGLLHTGTCPRVKAIEYHDNGLIKRIEFHEPPLTVGTVSE